MEQMHHMSTGAQATDPELDEALARAIRQFIAGVTEAGEAEPATAAV
jgi:hypothetical protein